MKKFETLVKFGWWGILALGVLIGICFLVMHLINPESISSGDIIGGIGVVIGGITSFLLGAMRIKQSQKNKEKEPEYESYESLKARIQQVKDLAENGDISEEAAKQLIEDMIVLHNLRGPTKLTDLVPWYANLEKVLEESRRSKGYYGETPDNTYSSPQPPSEEDWPTSSDEPPSTIEDGAPPLESLPPLKKSHELPPLEPLPPLKEPLPPPAEPLPPIDEGLDFD